jgi:hypothetical protein
VQGPGSGGDELGDALRRHAHDLGDVADGQALGAESGDCGSRSPGCRLLSLGELRAALAGVTDDREVVGVEDRHDDDVEVRLGASSEQSSGV